MQNTTSTPTGGTWVIKDPICTPALAAVLVVASLFVSNSGLADERIRVLEANERFYQAFRDRDIALMGDVWAEEFPVLLIHPSGWRLEGREEVMFSWRVIFPQVNQISCDLESAFQQGDVWRVVCDEKLGVGSVKMENRFILENGQWRMIYHGLPPENETGA